VFFRLPKRRCFCFPPTWLLTATCRTNQSSAFFCFLVGGFFFFLDLFGFLFFPPPPTFTFFFVFTAALEHRYRRGTSYFNRVSLFCRFPVLVSPQNIAMLDPFFGCAFTVFRLSACFVFLSDYMDYCDTCSLSSREAPTLVIDGRNLRAFPPSFPSAGAISSLVGLSLLCPLVFTRLLSVAWRIASGLVF